MNTHKYIKHLRPVIFRSVQCFRSFFRRRWRSNCIPIETSEWITWEIKSFNSRKFIKMISRDINASVIVNGAQINIFTVTHLYDGKKWLQNFESKVQRIISENNVYMTEFYDALCSMEPLIEMHRNTLTLSTWKAIGMRWKNQFRICNFYGLKLQKIYQERSK